MPESLNTPPPLPSEKPVSPTTILSWLIIIVSVAFLAWTANQPIEEELPLETASEQGLIPIDDANELAMLKIQSRFIIGVYQVNRPEAIRSLKQLESLAKTPRGKAAIAIVKSFVDQENGLKTGIDYLETIDTSKDSNQRLKTKVLSAIQDGVDEEQRSDLKREVGWFSKLLPPEDPANENAIGEAVRKESFNTMIKLGGFFSIAFLAGLSGFVLLMLFFINLSNGSIKLRFDATKGSGKRHLFLEAFAVYIGIMALGHWLAVAVDPIISIISYAASFLLAVMWPFFRGCSWKEARSLIGWNRGAGFFREIGAGIVGYLGIIIFAIVGLIGTLILIAIFNLIQGGDDPASAAGTSHPIVGMLDSADSIWGKLSLLFLAAGLAPLLEETMFRGALFRYMRKSWGFILSSVIGGIIFAIIHPQGMFALPALSMMGIGFALLREWRDSLIASMTAHALNNGMIVTLLLSIMT